jgi:hypothetical protein
MYQTPDYQTVNNILSNLKGVIKLGMVAHDCNPSKRIPRSRSTWGPWEDPFSKNINK